MQVDEGGLAVVSRDAARELSVKVAAAGSLVVSPEVTDEHVRTNGLYSEKTDAIVLTDATLAVNVAASAAFWESHTSFSIPICTVPKALGDQLAGKIKMIRHKGYNGVVTRQELAGDMSRFVLDVAKAGLVVVFR